MNALQQQIQQQLEERKAADAFRNTVSLGDRIDFVSNDYLGLGKMNYQIKGERSGQSASRLLGGNSSRMEALEQAVADFHGYAKALFFPTGYMANLALFSSLLTRHDQYIYDEYVHASIRDGMRLSHAHSFSFRHNDLTHLEERLQREGGNKVVVTESLFSMDGDEAPIEKILALCERYQASLIVDEAHTAGLIGLQGRGRLAELNIQDRVLASIVTYGKAFGAQGAVVLCDEQLRDYLINFARPFIYSTAPSEANVQLVELAYQRIQDAHVQREQLRANIDWFKDLVKQKELSRMLVQNGPVQIYLCPGNAKVKAVAEALRGAGLEVRAVLSPTVPAGQERIRICLHSYNTKDEIVLLLELLKQHE